MKRYFCVGGIAAAVVSSARTAGAHDATRTAESAVRQVASAFDQAEEFISTSNPAGTHSTSCAAAIEVSLHSPCEQEARLIIDPDARRAALDACDALRDGAQSECDARVQECQDNARGIHLAALAAFYDDDDGDGLGDGFGAIVAQITDCGAAADDEHIDCADDEACVARSDAVFARCAQIAINIGEDTAQTEIDLWASDADGCEAAVVEDLGDRCALIPAGVLPERALMTTERFGADGDFVARDDAECAGRALEINQDKWTRLRTFRDEVERIHTAARAEQAARIDADARLQAEAIRLEGSKVDKAALDSVDCAGDLLVEGADGSGRLRCAGPFQRRLFGFDASGPGPSCPAGMAMVGVGLDGDVRCAPAGGGASRLVNFTVDGQTTCTAQCSRAGMTVCNTEGPFPCECREFACNRHSCECGPRCWNRQWNNGWLRTRCGWSTTWCRRENQGWNCGTVRCDECYDICRECSQCNRALVSVGCDAHCDTAVPIAACDDTPATALTWCLSGWFNGQDCEGSPGSTSCSDADRCDTGDLSDGAACCTVRDVSCTSEAQSDFVQALCVQAL